MSLIEASHTVKRETSHALNNVDKAVTNKRAIG